MTLTVITLSSIAGSAPVGTAEAEVASVAESSLRVVSTSTSGAPVSGGRCPDARRAVDFYRRAYARWRERIGARPVESAKVEKTGAMSCTRARLMAKRLQRKARNARLRYEAWVEYHWHWWKWLPAKWARIGACETGYGRRPGQWTWNSGVYQGAFGFHHSSWDAFVRYADSKAGPYPSEAYLATPRQQYEVALAIWRRYGFSGWGCRNA